ncbi:hypothetical protein STZ1_30679 [Bacillus subtilis]
MVLSCQVLVRFISETHILNKASSENKRPQGIWGEKPHIPFLLMEYKDVKTMEVFPLAKIYRKTLSLYDYHTICDCNCDILLNASSTGRAIFR